MSAETRAFVDTNILVYTISDDAPKRSRARALLAGLDTVVISAQVLSEFTNVCLRRKLLSLDEIAFATETWRRAFEVVPVSAATVERAYVVKRRYGYSWWDSMMLSSALLAGCGVVYTEDLQHDQSISDMLRIENPLSG